MIYTTRSLSQVTSSYNGVTPQEWQRASDILVEYDAQVLPSNIYIYIYTERERERERDAKSV